MRDPTVPDSVHINNMIDVWLRWTDHNGDGVINHEEAVSALRDLHHLLEPVGVEHPWDMEELWMIVASTFPGMDPEGLGTTDPENLKEYIQGWIEGSDLSVHQMLEFLFNKIDSNGNGSIDINEAYEFFQAIGEGETDVVEWINSIDSNGNGELDFEELINGVLH